MARCHLCQASEPQTKMVLRRVDSHVGSSQTPGIARKEVWKWTCSTCQFKESILRGWCLVRLRQVMLWDRTHTLSVGLYTVSAFNVEKEIPSGGLDVLDEEMAPSQILPHPRRSISAGRSSGYWARP